MNCSVRDTIFKIRILIVFNNYKIQFRYDHIENYIISFNFEVYTKLNFPEP